jgi:hypothetical protein
MRRPTPTPAGDVLVMRTAESFAINVVGRISNDGQQDFKNQSLKCEKMAVHRFEYRHLRPKAHLYRKEWCERHDEDERQSDSW